MAATRAAIARKNKQEALREMLSKQKLVEKAIDNIKKMEELGAAMEPTELNALKYATDARLKLVNKYLSDLKSTELSMDGGGEGGSLKSIKIEFVDCEAPDSK